MTIEVRYFGSLAERLGRSDERLDLGTPVSIADVWAHVSAGQEPGGRILMALNMEYVKGDVMVSDGDEVAFFPPVTGG